jgi:hypothetical protein
LWIQKAFAINGEIAPESLSHSLEVLIGPLIKANSRDWILTDVKVVWETRSLLGW